MAFDGVRFETLGEIHLKSGGGGGDRSRGLCVMEMVDLLSGSVGRLTDRPVCACPVLTEFAIALNDSAPSAKMRDTLKPLALRLLNSRSDERAWARMSHVARTAAHKLVAPVDVYAARKMVLFVDAACRQDASQAQRLALHFAIDLNAYLRRRKVTQAHPLSASARWRLMRDILAEAIDVGAPQLDGDAPALKLAA